MSIFLLRIVIYVGELMGSNNVSPPVNTATVPVLILNHIKQLINQEIM